VNRIVYRVFKNYYRRVAIDDIPCIEKREFAFVLFDRPDVMIRHKAFNSINELKRFLANATPLHAYYSTAYYDHPEARDMDEKVWQGADIVFDIDVDHIPTPCKKIHDRWKCLDCGAHGRGMAPEKCPSCSSKRIDRVSWICDECIKRATDEVIKLIEEYLIKDFGLHEKELKIYFSGHRGFHVHVERKDLIELDQEARREIVDYIKGEGLILSVDVLRRGLPGPSLGDPGWLGRLTRGVYQLISCSDEESLLSMGFPRRDIDYILTYREKILQALGGDHPYWGYVAKLSKKAWKLIMGYVKQNYACMIDERVTTDIKRLIRLPGSIHGKTGMRVVKVELDELEGFNPFERARIIKGELKVYVREKLSIKLGGYTITEGAQTLPFQIALYLICRGRAEPLE